MFVSKKKYQEMVESRDHWKRAAQEQLDKLLAYEKNAEATIKRLERKLEKVHFYSNPRNS